MLTCVNEVLIALTPHAFAAISTLHKIPSDHGTEVNSQRYSTPF